ncbi:hypothetical protein [Salinispora tropica]|uniref:Uncharacterized protein n=1 Tax=Salinispora tropica (strain ATCC BAA-916 / DSM 44818 / JCM 13857 / NBRC 105044 / CNB-440) TaxID=369723 RepID=A4X9C0_SALTO|nr:hypothetical protein [Salinispora tropica]ABP55487.1 hypothetical protein Strop_3050 [Salinispora tropica CNB-440]
MPELRLRASGLLTPTSGGPRLTVSLDVVQLRRDASGRVVGSERVGGSAADAAAKNVALLLTDATARIDATLDGLQSAVATIHEWRAGDGLPVAGRSDLLVRIETAGGPVVLGTAGHGTPLELVSTVAGQDLAVLAHPPAAEPPTGWRDRPLILRPAPAAVLVAGAAFSLSSRKGRRTAAQLTGRRVLPALTIRDLPAVPSGYDRDDLGDPAEASVLVDAGRISPPGQWRDGVPPGRAVWDHDAATCGPPPIVRLELDGPDTVTPPNAIELQWCVEGLQRYHGDGTIRVHCVARPVDRPEESFVIVLHGKPIHLLRHTRGLTGPRTAVYGDSDVTTRSLVLASAAELEGAGHAVVTVNS